jgi:phage shock protein PspC (stress-responsive transcriptional regulator)
MRSLDLPRQPGWIGGVCAGIAARLGIDPLIVRGIVVVVAVLGGPALLLYAAAWLLLPDAANKIHLEELFRGRLESPLAGIAALVALALLPIGHGFWTAGYWDGWWAESVGSTIWTVLLLASVIWFIVWIARRAQSGGAPVVPPLPFDAVPVSPPTDAPPEDVAAWRAQQAAFKAEHNRYRNEEAAAASAAAREQSRAAAAAARADYLVKRERTRPNSLFTLSVVGVALIAGALTMLGISDGEPSLVDIVPGLAVSLAVLALGIIINGVRGKRSGGASPIAVFVIFVMVVISLVPQVPRVMLTGDLSISPTSRQLNGTPWVVGEGDVTVDLTDAFVAPVSDNVWYTQPELKTYVGWGDVTVIIPNDEYVSVSVEVSGDGVVELPEGDLSGGTTDSSRFDRTQYTENYSINGDTDWADTKRSIFVRVWVGDGNVTIVRAPATAKESN